MSDSDTTCTLWCLIEEDDIPFSVTVSPTTSVDDLKETIKVKNIDLFEGIGSRSLILWKPKEPIAVKPDITLARRIGHWFPGPDFSRFALRLDASETVADVFQNQNRTSIIFPPPGHLHAFVAQSKVRKLKRKRDDDTETDIPPGVKLLRAEVGGAAPSTLAKPSNFREIAGPGHVMACNRPFEYDTLPLVLLHEVFGMFKDRCNAAPSEQALAFHNKLTFAACKLFEDEDQRRSTIWALFQEYLDIQFHEEKVINTEYTTDGNFVVNVMPAAIWGCKNETRHALNQAIIYYSRFLIEALKDYRQFYNCNTCFPCILIVDMGSSMGFYGAAWDGNRVKVEPLAPGLDLTTHWKERNARNAIASCFDAFVVATKNIEAHYRSIMAWAQAWGRVCQVPMCYDPHIQKARMFPFLKSYSDNGTETSFTYRKQFDKDKLVFSANINQPGSGECIIKFTWQYSEAAHVFLAILGLVPAVRKVIRISADWTAVIMDKSEYKVLYGTVLSKAEQEKVRGKVSSIVQTLHEGGFVHGDIRDTNLLIDRASLTSDNVKIHLIDFDWAGFIGEARYPVEINCETLRRPEGVKGGELITEQYDHEMISYLFGN